MICKTHQREATRELHWTQGAKSGTYSCCEECASTKHGFDAVRWVVNKRTEEIRLRKELSKEQKKLNDRIAEIQKKLGSK